MPAKPPAVVAELGRPETPSETADRKAEASRRRRVNQTAFNLVVATVASLLIVLFLVVVVVRPTPAPTDPVDYVAIAAEADGDLLAPLLPEGWAANNARLAPEGDVSTWTVGFVTPKQQFIALSQGIAANATWLSASVDAATETGRTSIGGLDWTVYDRRGERDTGNYAYSMSTQLGADLVVLNGTASDAEFQTLAAAIAKEN